MSKVSYVQNDICSECKVDNSTLCTLGVWFFYIAYTATSVKQQVIDFTWIYYLAPVYVKCHRLDLVRIFVES